MENKIYGYIYLITNLINGKQYVGQTVQTIKKRFSQHVCDSKSRDNGMLITRSIRKYKCQNFKIEEIDTASNQNELNSLEGVYISWFNTLAPDGYNLTNIINGKGRVSNKTREKMVIAQNKPEKIKISSDQGKKRRNKICKNSTSKYIGVCFNKYTNKYRSGIYFNKKRMFLGNYNIESDAARAYDIAAIKYFGNYAILNFPELLEDYINEKIIINKSTRQTKSKSGIENIHYDKHRNGWVVKYFNNTTNKHKHKNFKILKEAIEFQNNL